jgi:hypothetical protein
MRRALLLSLLFIVPARVSAQGPGASLVLDDPAFASWTTGPATPVIAPDAVRVPVEPSHRIRNALIGGAIGAAAGAVVCTVISTIADDSASARISTCTWNGYLLLGSIGFAAGFGIGLAI